MNHTPEFRGKNISIGENVTFGRNVVIYDEVEIGEDTTIGDFCVIGHPANEPSSWTILGKSCVIRSHTIVYSGAALGEGCSTGHHVSIRERSAIGNGCSIGSYSDLQGHLKMGNYCRLHSNVHLCQGSELEDFVFIYPRVTLTNDSYPPSTETRGPKVGAYSQICTGSIILPGLEIGDNCLIGAASLVTKDIPKHSVAFGHPAIVKGDVSALSTDGKPHYPWMYRFDRNMPWEGRDFDDWLSEQK